MKDNIGGISLKNRVLLGEINRKAKGPFSINEFAGMLGMPLKRAKRLVLHWVSMGWLTRIKKGLYSTVPLEAVHPGERREDPWIVAARVFSPCYIGGWSACEHWGFTEQIFRDVVVFSGKDIRKRRQVIQGTIYIVKGIKKSKIFGTKPIWRGQVKVLVSDPRRTIVDLLDEPALGGGIRHIALMVKEYFSGEERNDKELFEYIKRNNNRAVYKRLGYLIETLKIDAPELLNACKINKSSGFTNLDPSLPIKGKIIRKWNLRVNALIP